jgi:DNA mismatch repair protein MutS
MTTSRGGQLPSLLFADPSGPREGGEREEDRSYARDLNLDQVVTAIAEDREERDLITETLYGHLRDADAVRYRQEVFRDLDDPAVGGQIRRFADQMAEVGAHLSQLGAMRYRYQREGWLLDAAAIYCAAVRSLTEDLGPARLTSRALLAFRDYLAGYATSAGFTGLARDTSDTKDALGRIRYGTRIRGDRGSFSSERTVVTAGHR